MTKVLLFVHGTGVRSDAYAKSLNLVERHAAHFGVSVKPCFWGGEVGATLKRAGASIPTYGDTRGAPVGSEEMALWDLLLQDPTFELGILANLPAEPRGTGPNAGSPLPALERAFLALPQSVELSAKLVELGLDGGPPVDGVSPLAKLIMTIDASVSGKAAKLVPAKGGAAHKRALARAVVAGLMREALDNAVPVPDNKTRDELVVQVRSLMGNDSRSAALLAMAPFAGMAAYLGTIHSRRHRGSVTDAAYPAAGDILLYQARGAALRDFIRARIDELPDAEVTVLAHSLGGIAAVEMLAQKRPANVKRLITFGSQAPFLHEIGALATMPAGNELPADFPQWVNFYDLNDPLSYIAEGIFPKARDIKIDSGQSFPASHSAYLHNAAFWEHIRRVVDA